MTSVRMYHMIYKQVNDWRMKKMRIERFLCVCVCAYEFATDLSGIHFNVRIVLCGLCWTMLIGLNGNSGSGGGTKITKAILEKEKNVIWLYVCAHD